MSCDKSSYIIIHEIAVGESLNGLKCDIALSGSARYTHYGSIASSAPMCGTDFSRASFDCCLA